MLERASFNASCDRLLDQITIKMMNADVTDEDEVKILCDNAKALRDAKSYGRGGIWRWLKQLTPDTILKAALTIGMYRFIMRKEDEGVYTNSRATNWIPWTRSPK